MKKYKGAAVFLTWGRDNCLRPEDVESGNPKRSVLSITSPFPMMPKVSVKGDDDNRDRSTVPDR